MKYAALVTIGVVGTAAVSIANAGRDMTPADRQSAPAQSVSMVRLPSGALQPRVAVDAQGAAHVVYYKGEAAAGDLFYSRLSQSGVFSAPLRVNTQPASAVAVGNIRGASLAIGRNGRVHVVWNGSGRATPRAVGGATPMLYTRLNGTGAAFEAERNLLQTAVGLDGGGNIAADANGGVFVAWHAGGPTSKGEGDRRVWLVSSTDDGATFTPEVAVSPAETGACGCCGMGALFDRSGALYFSYRAARDVVHRDAYLLTSRDRGRTFSAAPLEPWNIGACPMSSFSIVDAPAHVIAAWETAGAISFTAIDRRTGTRGPIATPPGTAGQRKHPAVAVNSKGDILLAWTDGVAWQKGGAVEWRVFGANGQPTSVSGRETGVPTWSLVAAYARPDDGFVIVY